MSLNKTYQRTLILTLLVKLTLAFFLPMSGDEAYFIIWAKNLDFGYYDHPPMVGWIIYLMGYFGDSELVMRLPAVLLFTMIGMGIYRLLQPYDANRAAWVAIIYLISPVNILGVLITTDVPLILFCFLSVYALVRALQLNQLLWYILSGVALGLAFLSKYFAVLIGLAYLMYFIFTPNGKQRWIGFSLLILASLPFVAVNVYWNYTHCWVNILFNIYNRNEGVSFSYNGVLAYFATTLYLMSPPVAYYLWRQYAGAKPFEAVELRLYTFAFLVPMAVFLILSLKKSIGVHWFLAFYPFFYLLLAQKLSELQLKNVAKFLAWFTSAHLLVIAVLLIAPTSMLQHFKFYSGYVFLIHTDELAAQLRPYEGEFLMSTDSYSDSAVISYHYGKELFVFGDGSHHARQDDINTDFRKMFGRDILIFDKSIPNLSKFTPYFSSVVVHKLKVRDAVFYVTLGYNFNYSAYRDEVLYSVREKYYQVPSFLPLAPCYFREKYFSDN